MKIFPFHPLSSCVKPDLCDDNRNKPNVNPRTTTLDILNGLISSAQDAKCPNESDVCCAKKFTKNPGKLLSPFKFFWSSGALAFRTFDQS